MTNGSGVHDVKTRSIVVVVVAAAAAIAAVGFWRPSLPVGDTANGSSDSATPVLPTPASTSASPSSTNGDDAPTDAREIDPAWRTPSSPSPRYAEPEDIERQLAQFIAEQPGLEIVSISSINCGATACEIALSGTEVNPRYVGAYSGLQDKLFQAPWNDFRILFGGISTREAQHILRGLQGLNLIGGDVVEVSPPFDPSGNTALVGATLMFEIMCLLADAVARRRGGQGRPL